MSDPHDKPSLPTRAKSTALHGIGILCTMIGSGLSAHLLDIGHLITIHPRITIGVSAAAGTILYAWVLWTWYLWKQTSDLRLRERFEHDTASNISIEHSGNNKGRKACTRCLNKIPAHDYPLHDPYTTGRWECSGCGATYETAAFKAAQKLHFEEKPNQQKPRDRTYS